MRPLIALHMAVIRPLAYLIKVPTHMLRLGTDRHLAGLDPLPRRR